ncbi:cutinase family protein [Mycolicibacterium mucogenicum]|uniref:cutinase family protein n=1 Tax=Mycolicibacterium mucogenicum TaxID=56689 RepID=UPI003977B619
MDRVCWIGALTAVAGASVMFTLADARAAECSDVAVVFARGTNEAPGVGAVGQAFVDALTARLPQRGIDVYGVDYPASYDFPTAVTGIIDATHHIEAVAATCPHTKIVLGGYSQGAAVAGYTTVNSVPPGFVLPPGIDGPIPPEAASHVAAVVLFGTPQAWLVGLADHDAPPLAIGTKFTAKTLQLCAPNDPVCAEGGLDRAAHHAYLDNGMTDRAADFAAAAV